MSVRRLIAPMTVGLAGGVAVLASLLAGGGPRASLVFEAEEVTEVDGTWELRSDPRASGGAVLHVGEGTGRNNPDIYRPPRHRFMGRAYYDIQVPEAGSYVLWGLCWSSDQCGNSCWVGFDTETPVYFPEGQKGADGFIWEEERYGKWLWLKLPPVRLSAGRHRMRVEVREDGFRIDQWALLPKRAPQPSGRLQSNSHPLPPRWAWMRVYPRSHVAYAGGEVVAEVWLRPGSRGDLSGRLEVSPPKGVTASPAEIDVTLEPVAPLRRVDVKLRHPEEFSRGEHLYCFTFRPEEGEPLAQAVRLSRPFLWEVLAPLPLEGGASSDRAGLSPVPSEPPPGRWPGRSETVGGLRGRVVWGLSGDLAEWFTPYGFLDFERALGPTEYALALVRTTVHAPEAGPYVLEVLTDDEACLWVNGRRVYDNPRRKPATDHFAYVPVRLEKGANELALAVRQHTHWWEMRVRVLKADGGVSGVR